MLDSFTLAGPNGTHDCLVLKLLGPSVADIIEFYCNDDRLPGSLAKSFARQAMHGLDFLACHDIGHGGKSIPMTADTLQCIILI